MVKGQDKETLIWLGVGGVTAFILPFLGLFGLLLIAILWLAGILAVFLVAFKVLKPRESKFALVAWGHILASVAFAIFLWFRVG